MVTGQSNNPTGKLEGLQVLRGIAALLVVWCHLKCNLGLPANKLATMPLLATDLGGIGVDIFFVISGFVIAMTADRVGNNWRLFLTQRIARIVPLYFTVSCYLLILMVLFNAITNPQDGFKWLSFPLLFNSFCFIPLFDHAHFTNPVCINGWTLSFEMWFYLCFAGLIAMGNGKKAGRLMPIMIVTGVAGTAIFYHSAHWYMPKFLFNPLTLEFAAGCLLYITRDWLQRRAFIGFYIAGLALFFSAARAEFLGQHQMVLASTSLAFYRAGAWGGFAVCLVGFITQIDLKYPRRWSKLLLTLGEASYSIYLVAPLIMMLLLFMNLGLEKLTPFHPIQLPPIIRSIVYVLGTVIGGIWLWKYFEMPATAKFKNIFARHLLATKASQAIPSLKKLTS